MKQKNVVNGVRVQQIQNWFEESVAGRQCKGRLPRLFARLTRVSYGHTRANRLNCDNMDSILTQLGLNYKMEHIDSGDSVLDVHVENC